MASVRVDASFLSEHSAFFQTIAQVQAGVLVAFALTQFGEDDAARGVRPPVIVAVVLGAIALAAGVAGTTPLLPRWLQRWAFGVAMGGGAGSLVSLAYVSWRLLR